VLAKEEEYVRLSHGSPCGNRAAAYTLKSMVTTSPSRTG